MESLSLRWYTNSARSTASSTRFTVSTREITRIASRWAQAGAVAVISLLVATWAAITPSVDQFLSASLWAAAFVFFALAMEVGLRKVIPYVATGLVLPVLAVMGTEIAAEFSVLASAIVAGWLAYWVASRQ